MFLIYRICMCRTPAKPVRAYTLRNWHLILHITFEAPRRTLHLTVFLLHIAYFTLHPSHCTLYTAQFAVNTLLHTVLLRLHTLPFTLHTLHFTLYTALFALQTSYFTVPTSHFLLLRLYSKLGVSILPVCLVNCLPKIFFYTFLRFLPAQIVRRRQIVFGYRLLPSN